MVAKRKRIKRDRRPICTCAAYNFPHKRDIRRCDQPELTDNTAADEWVQRMLDRPMRISMGAGSYGRPAIDDILDDPRRYEK